jgi:hypothetical protein
MATELYDPLENYAGPLVAPQMPRLFVEPDRHKLPEPKCAACGGVKPGRATGCGQEQAIDALEWAEAFGYELDPWQKWSIENMMSTKPDGYWAAPDCLLVVSRQNGKGTILEVRELAGLFVLSEELIIHTAHQFKTSLNHFKRLKQTIENYPGLSRKIKRIAGSHGEESIELFPKRTLIFGPNKTQLRRRYSPTLAFHARQGSSGGRGFSCNCLVYDEAMILSDEQVGASMPTMSAIPNAQTILAGSAGLKDSLQLAKYRNDMVAHAPEMFGAEYSVVPHTDECPRDEIHGRKSNYYIVCDQHDDRDDPASWLKANPAIGYRLTLEFTRRELRKIPDAEFDRERLAIGEWPIDEEAWAVISKESWQKLANEEPGFPAIPLCFAVDIDEDGSAATISAAWDHKEGRIVIEVPRNCSRSGSDWVLDELKRLYSKHRPLAIAVPKSGPAAALLEDGKKLWRDRLVPVGPGDEAAAFAWFMQQVKHEKLWHFGEEKAPTLWHSMGQADVRVMGDGGKAWSRRDSLSDITPVTSATLAAWVLNMKRRSYDPLKSIG